MHNPGRKNGNLLAVYPKAVEAPVTPPNFPFSVFYHLISVFVLYLEIPITGGVFKETVKINLAEPILSTNHSDLDFSTPQVSPQCSRVHSQNTRSLAECQ
jgi:hypothetical protein